MNIWEFRGMRTIILYSRDDMQTGRLLMILGAAIFAAGLFFYFGGRLNFLGHLPGDIHISRGQTDFYFPIVSCALVSLIGTILLNLFFRR